MDYPVKEILEELRSSLQRNPITILQAPPGAGKSTLVPLELLNEPWLQSGKIIMLQPRRLATRSVAERLAQNLGERTGNTVGYRIRFETCVSEKTRIEVVTEGILTRMIQSDNALDGISLVIFDEFHERSLQADLALALCQQSQQVLREDLRILIMSATLDGEALSTRLKGAPVIVSSGKQFPVAINYLGIPRDDEHISSAMSRAIIQAIREQEGDILALLPGTGEIRQTQERLMELSIPAALYPLYGDLPYKQQQLAIMPDARGMRKVVLATSIAETSLTIEGIKVVIDSGLARIPRFDPRSGLTRLTTVRITKDSADQRAGRAGRVAPGTCYRLWNAAIHHSLTDHRSPEIADADLASLVLELTAWGIHDLDELNWITPPPSGAYQQALQLLNQLDAIDDVGKITNRGKRMVQLPTHPRLAHMLIESEGNTIELAYATDLASVLEERDPLPKEAGSDIGLRIEALRKWRKGERTSADVKVLERIERLASSWRKVFNLKVMNDPAPHYMSGKLVALAYPERIAQQQQKNQERYKLVNARTVLLPQHDSLVTEPWLAIAQMDLGTKEGKIFTAAALDQQDLTKLAREHTVIRWNETSERVEALLEKRVGMLVLDSKLIRDIPELKKQQIIIQVIREKGLTYLGWNEQHESWQARVMSLKAWRSNEPWPDVSDHALLVSLPDWLGPHLSLVARRSDLTQLDLMNILLGLLPWELQNKLDVLAPARIEVPSGSMIRVQYFADGRSPIMEVRLQEIFGLLETPTINEGRTQVVMHLLSPGFKPVQVTQDLHSFWQNTYFEVRKELRTRYPKHSWPENPWTAQAVRGVKRKG
ncbi:MAG: ATP-dependent helicase HrpB [Cyclobacteriaceae bacterium]|nr:ATP-dependent helicase HrpB [Cyclobacteriaceae bacterium]